MGYSNVIWDYDTDDWKLPPGGSMTPQGVDDEFTKWISAAPNDTTGHMVLEHELYQATVDAAIRNLAKIQATWKVMPVSTCMNDAHPYKETNITLATLDGTATTGVTNANTNTNSSSGSPSSTPSGTTQGDSSGSKTSGSSSSISVSYILGFAATAVLAALSSAMV